LIWPAVAGNVAWSFFTVVISESWKCPSVPERITVLLLLAIYLATDYTSIETELLKPMYWIADAFHALSMIVFAIATQFNAIWLNESLIAIFIVAAGGHITGLWEPTGCSSKNRWRKRLILVGINLIGIVVTIIFSIIILEGTLWNLPLAFFVVLVLWYFRRNEAYKTEPAS